ncbi:hypothetical protein PR048_006887 [Dryococelus australis]|uniref:Uncharacterized protein n=1 Tax=Dryococelus australis TaxID=614101 RepID=A0ABQ9IC70_9NEOP|nr:hypothetical protein PR048_006887 [Dryococelus australis]
MYLDGLLGPPDFREKKCNGVTHVPSSFRPRHLLEPLTYTRFKKSSDALWSAFDGAVRMDSASRDGLVGCLCNTGRDGALITPPPPPQQFGYFPRSGRVNGHGGWAVKPLASHQVEPGSIPGRFTPDFRTWETCRAMPLVCWSSRDLPFSPPFHSGAAPYLPHFTLIGSQDHDAARISLPSGRIEQAVFQWKHITWRLLKYGVLRRSAQQASWDIHLGRRQMQKDSFHHFTLPSYRRHIRQLGLIPWLVEGSPAYRGLAMRAAIVATGCPEFCSSGSVFRASLLVFGAADSGNTDWVEVSSIQLNSLWAEVERAAKEDSQLSKAALSQLLNGAGKEVLDTDGIAELRVKVHSLVRRVDVRDGTTGAAASGVSAANEFDLVPRFACSDGAKSAVEFPQLKDVALCGATSFDQSEWASRKELHTRRTFGFDDRRRRQDNGLSESSNPQEIHIQPSISYEPSKVLMLSYLKYLLKHILLEITLDQYYVALTNVTVISPLSPLIHNSEENGKEEEEKVKVHLMRGYCAMGGEKASNRTNKEIMARNFAASPAIAGLRRTAQQAPRVLHFGRRHDGERRRLPLGNARYPYRMLQSALILQPMVGVHAYQHSARHSLFAATAFMFPYETFKNTSSVLGATVPERLACSPSTKRIWFNPRPGHRIFARGNRAGRLSRRDMEQQQYERTGDMGNPRENSPTSGIVRHYSHVQKYGSDPAGNLTWFV